ncbi:MAG: hypothetical protein ABEJ31_08620 [Haloarculaceae archaeon]
MSQSQSIDYPAWTKRGFLFGVGLFVLAELVDAVGPSVLGPLPGWEQTVLLLLAVVGVLVGLLSPLLFGIVLPLIE